MDVSLMIRRHKTTIFTDAKKNTTVGEVKRMIEGILKIKPECQILYNMKNVEMDDEKTLQDYGISSCPLLRLKDRHNVLGLAIKNEESAVVEALEITPYSSF